MYKIKRTVDLNTITGNTIVIPIFLTQKTENLGLWEDYSTDLTMSSGITVTVTGLTNNKLTEVRGYDYSNPYTVGSNGITAQSSTEVSYTIGNINYITELSGLTTTFSFTDTRTIYLTNNFIS